MMSSNPYISSGNKADFICSVNGDIIRNSIKNPTSIPANQTKESWDKFRECSMTKWHPSKLEGYVSEELRSVKLVD